MKKRFFALTLALCVAGIGFANAAEQKGEEKKNDAPVAAEAKADAPKAVENVVEAQKETKKKIAQMRGVTFGLFVGCEIDERNPKPPVSFSKADLESAKSVLGERAKLAPVYAATMTSESKKFFMRPTRANVLSMLRRIAEEARENDTVWVVFSGEGFSIDGDAAFIPSDARTGDAKNWIFDSEVREILAASKANKIAVVWLTGRFERRDLKKPERPQAQAVQPREGAERVAIFACSKGERVRESVQAKLDFFWSELTVAAKTTEGFLEGATLRQAFDAAAAKIVAATKDSELGAQTPEWQNF